ncbi:sugar transferase [Lacticaseibacillus sp. 53-4]|uniref:sugar transferase n=1 Tax=Lacticaseibacillus sp. 53-4 TaxID=2799575 RepID=UPI001942204A|nr:sugar transferase [Lacticaseibacillus sp. 53-4]
MKSVKQWSGLKRLGVVIVDLLLFHVSILLSYYFRFGITIPQVNLYSYQHSAIWLSIVFLIVNYLLGVYVYYNRRVSDIVFLTVLGQTIAIAALMVITFIGRLFAFPRSVLLLSLIISILILAVWRTIVYYLYIAFTPDEHVAVISYEDELPAIIQNFSSSKNNKHRVRYVITDHFLDNVKAIIDKVDIFYITDTISDEERRAIVDYVIKNEKHLMLPSTFDNLLMLRPNLMNFEDESVMGISDFRLSPENAALKRLFDILVALVLLVVASPFMLITAILVKLTSPGPIIYKQTRITLNQREFKIYKFRTMSATAEAKSGPVLAQANDSRITPVGKYLRKLRLDELPQIFNVLKGDMSIVGPRPERPYFVNQFNKQEPHYYLRHNVRAGITGYAQVYGKYASNYRSKLKFDLLYIKCYSLTLDFKILLQTIKILFDKVSSQGLDEDEKPSMKKLQEIVSENDIEHMS